MGAYADLVAADGAIDHWPLDDASGNFANLITPARTGVPSGTFTRRYAGRLLAEDKLGVRLQANAFVEIASGMNWASGAYSIELWVIPVGTVPSGANFLIGKGNSASNLNGIYAAAGGGLEFFSMRTADNKDAYHRPTPANLNNTAIAIAADTRAHLVITVDSAGDLRWYVNGVQYWVRYQTAPSYSSSWALAKALQWRQNLGSERIGKMQSAYVNSDVVYGDVAFYNLALTADQVADHYALGVAIAVVPVEFDVTGSGVKSALATGSVPVAFDLEATGESDQTPTGYAAAILDLDPIGYWRFNEPPSPVAVIDQSVNDRPLTIYGNPVFGDVGLLVGDGSSSANFDGSGDLARRAASTAYDTTAGALTMVIENGANPGAFVGLAGVRGPIYDAINDIYTDGVRWWLSLGPTNDGFSLLNDPDGTADAAWILAMAEGEVHHLVLNFDASSSELFVDGVSLGAGAEGRGSQAGVDFVVGGRLTVGNPVTANQPTQSFNGNVQEVALFDRKLTSGEAAQLAEVAVGGGGRFGDGSVPLGLTVTGTGHKAALGVGSVPLAFEVLVHGQGPAGESVRMRGAVGRIRF